MGHIPVLTGNLAMLGHVRPIQSDHPIQPAFAFSQLCQLIISISFQDIDSYINKASDQGYSAVLSIGSKSISYASNMILNTAIKVCIYYIQLSVVYMNT